MSKETSSVMFKELLPASISHDEQFLAAATVLDQERAYVDVSIDALALYARIDEMGEDLLKHLAYQWHVDFWDDSLELEQKRQLVKDAYQWHRIKGTPQAVELLVGKVLGGGYVQEWFEYDGEPYHFRVVSNTAPGNIDIYNQLLDAIEQSKNERSVLDTIIQSTPILGRVLVGGVCVCSSAVTICQEV